MTITPNSAHPAYPAYRISIIVRTLGRPELCQALDSIIAQTLQPQEVLLINAGNQARLPVTPCQREVLPLREVRPGRLLNRPQAANAGLDAARGNWLCFLDDDDFYHPDHLASLVDALERHRSARAAYSGFLMLRDDDRPHARLSRPFDRDALLRGNYIQMGAALFARSLVDDGARFDESLLNYQDWDFWLQLAERTDFVHTGDVTLSWRAFRGQSGSGMGANADLALQARYTRHIQAKWARRLAQGMTGLPLRPLFAA